MKFCLLLFMFISLFSCTDKKINFSDNAEAQLMKIKDQLKYDNISSLYKSKQFNWGTRYTLIVGEDKVHGKLGNGKTYEMATLTISIEYYNDGRKNVAFTFLETLSKSKEVREVGRKALSSMLYEFIGGKENWESTYNNLISSLPLDPLKKFTFNDGPLKDYSSHIQYEGEQGFIVTLRNYKK